MNDFILENVDVRYKLINDLLYFSINVGVIKVEYFKFVFVLFLVNLFR